MKNKSNKNPDLEKILSSIPEVDIPHQGRFKFIQLNYGDRTFIYGTNLSRHALIHFDFDEKYQTDQLQYIPIVRGGRIHISADEKTLRVFGTSFDYGKYDGESLRPILKKYMRKNFPGWKLKIS